MRVVEGLVQGEGEGMAGDTRKAGQNRILTTGADVPIGLFRSGMWDTWVRRKNGW